MISCIHCIYFEQLLNNFFNLYAICKYEKPEVEGNLKIRFILNINFQMYRIKEPHRNHLILNKTIRSFSI